MRFDNWFKAVGFATCGMAIGACSNAGSNEGPADAAIADSVDARLDDVGPADGGPDDADPVIDASGEHDGNSDGGPAGPPFEECRASVILSGENPLAILEVTQQNSSGGQCPCAHDYRYVPGRTICGRFDADAGVSILAPTCNPGTPPPEAPGILVVRRVSCRPGIHSGAFLPMDAWDAVVAEQCAKHPGCGDGGGVDVVDASTDSDWLMSVEGG